MMKRPAVFLDRDNTVIDGAGSAADPASMKLAQGVAPAIASLCGLGYKVVVVANDPGVATGVYELEDVDVLHDRVRELVSERVNGARIDGFYVCPFDPSGTVAEYKKDHADRLPKPGMLKRAAEELQIDLDQSWMVGDDLDDISAGAAAGCRTVMLNVKGAAASMDDLRKASPSGKKGGRGKGKGKVVEPDFLAKGLVEAVRIIASQRKPEASEDISRTRVAGKRWDAQAMAELQRLGRRKPGESAEAEPPVQATDQDASPKAADAEATKPAARPPRPFRPWTVAAEEPDEPVEDKPAATESPAPPSAEPVKPADQPAPTTAQAVAPAQAPPAVTPDPEPTPTAAPEPVVAKDETSKPVASEPAVEANERTLRLILHELRVQRGSSGEVPQLQIVAIVLQTVAVICLLAALWMGGGEGGNALFLRWLGVGLMLQMATIAVLLFGRSSS